jgi:hypothetical protein
VKYACAECFSTKEFIGPGKPENIDPNKYEDYKMRFSK